MINEVLLDLGDDLGKIWVYDVGEQLAVPQQDEYNKFVNTLQVSLPRIFALFRTI